MPRFAESTRTILNVWKNKLNLNVDIDNGSLNWVKNNHVQINNIIKKYDNKLTQKNHYSILQMILRDTGPKKLYEKYSKIFEDLREEVNNKNKKIRE